MHHVYKLTVPGDSQHLYIGTTNNPHARLVQHKINASGNPQKHQWIKDAVSKGIQPKLEVIATFEDRKDAFNLESQLITEAMADPNLIVMNMAKSNSDIPRRRTPEGRRRTGDANRIHQSQLWEVTDPAGNTFQVTNMKEFCDQNNLDPSTMTKVSRGKQDNHKGYRCVKLT